MSYLVLMEFKDGTQMEMDSKSKSKIWKGNPKIIHFESIHSTFSLWLNVQSTWDLLLFLWSFHGNPSTLSPQLRIQSTWDLLSSLFEYLMRHCSHLFLNISCRINTSSPNIYLKPRALPTPPHHYTVQPNIYLKYTYTCITVKANCHSHDIWKKYEKMSCILLQLSASSSTELRDEHTSTYRT